MARHQQPRLEKRKLKDLKDYPRQQEFCRRGLREHELRALAKSMRQGKVPPIEVLPENAAGLPADTTLRGHQRRRALELDGQTEAQVLVRHDLAHADRATLDREFLVENKQRQHWTMLEQARAALELYKLELDDPNRKLDQAEELEVRDRIAQTMGSGPKNAQRYYNVLLAPDVVQAAFEDGKLALVEAASIGVMRAEEQARIAARIEAGEPAKAVLADYRRPKKQSESLAQALHRLIRELTRCQTEFAGHIASLQGGVWDNRIEGLRKGSKFIAAVVTHLQRCKNESKRRLEANGHAPADKREHEEEE